jgi:hypothetical protein
VRVDLIYHADMIETKNKKLRWCRPSIEMKSTNDMAFDMSFHSSSPFWLSKKLLAASCCGNAFQTTFAS